MTPACRRTPATEAQTVHAGGDGGSAGYLTWVSEPAPGEH
jgi:hypothetical protein